MSTPIALVTGCRSGFGLLAAVELARRGMVVHASLRDVDTAQDLQEAARAAGVQDRVLPLQLDVTQQDQRQAAIQHIIDSHGRLDALVNNAGIAIGGFQEQLSEDEVRRTFDVNVFAVWALTRVALPHLRASQGSVVNVSSVAGRIAMPGLGIYAASKHALEGMTEALRHELRPFGVRVTLVEPGPYKTDILARNRMVGAAATDPDSPYAPYVRRGEALEQRIVAGIKNDPQDVADKIADVVEAAGPRLRHPMGNSAWVRLFIRWLLPFSVWEWAIGQALRPR